jgi:hypothetical protein
MSLEPVDWSVVVAARWNRAILTPAGIRQRIFGISDEEFPLEVMIPIDLLAPPQVTLNEMVVIANWNRLVVRPKKLDFESLCGAMSLALNAVNSLPETPFEAVGINIAYKIDDSEPLESALKVGVDEKFGDAQLVINGRESIRILEWRTGKINVRVSNTEQLKSIQLNIEIKSSEIESIRKWLQLQETDIREISRKIIVDCYAFDEDEPSND